jgi:hypothetical protein
MGGMPMRQFMEKMIVPPGSKKPTGGPPITSVGHTADEHNARGGGDAPAGPERKGIRIQKKAEAGPAVGLGGRKRNRNGSGLNIGGY